MHVSLPICQRYVFFLARHPPYDTCSSISVSNEYQSMQATAQLSLGGKYIRICAPRLYVCAFAGNNSCYALAFTLALALAIIARNVCITAHLVRRSLLALLASATRNLSRPDDAPTFLETFVEQTLEPGPPVSLKCAASGNPLPQITWSLDGYAVPDNARFRTGDYVTPEGLLVSYVNITSVIAQGMTCVVYERCSLHKRCEPRANSQLDLCQPRCVCLFAHRSPLSIHSNCVHTLVC